jgi:hypothetical protein
MHVDHYPFLTIPPPILPPAAQRFVKRGFYMCCVTCGLTIDYCNCATRPPLDVGSGDGAAESSLEARARAVKGAR